MRRFLVVLMLLAFAMTWGQVQMAFDADTLIATGQTVLYGTFGMGLVDTVTSHEPFEFEEIVLTYGGAHFGGAGTTFPSFYLDGDVYSANPVPPDGVTPILPSPLDPPHYEELQNALVADWFVDSVQFTQTLHPFSVDSLGAIGIRYSIINHSGTTRQVGAMLFLDTNIGGSDAAPFAFPGETGTIDSTAVYHSSELPAYWSIYQFGPEDTSDTQIVVRCQLEGEPNVTPDWVAIGNQRSLMDVIIWDLGGLEIEEITDGAVVLQWGPVTLMPGEDITFGTTYGLAPSGAFIGGLLGVRIEVPRRMEVQFCELIPNPINAGVLFRNTTDSTMYNVFTWFEFEEDFVILDPPPDSTIWLGDTMFSSEIFSNPWQVLMDPRPDIDTNIHFTLHARADPVYDPDSGFFVDVETDIDGTIFVEGATYIGPTAEAVYPLTGTYTSNAEQPICVYLYDDDTLVAPLSLRLGFVSASLETLPWLIRPPIGGSTYENDTFYYPNEIFRVNGEVVRYFIIPTYDFYGCPLIEPLSVYYTVDLTPPVLTDYWPFDFEVFEDSLMIPWAKIEDYINRIDTALLFLTIADDESSHTHNFLDAVMVPLLSYDFDSSKLYITPADIGWRWPDGLVTLTVDSCCDAPDYGIPNCADVTAWTWDFIMNAHGPRAFPRTPDDGWFVSIQDPEIMFYLYDGNCIVVSSVRYSVDDVGYPAPGDYALDDSLLTHISTSTWPNAYIVDVEVIAAEDTFGKPLDMTSHTAWSFTIDIAHPVIELTSPDTIGDPTPFIEFWLYDSLAGVDETTIAISVGGIVYLYDDPAVEFFGDNLTWDAEIAGVEFDDDIVICISAGDLIDMGDTNYLDTCITIIAMLEAPYVDFLPGTGICSPDAAIEVYLYDDDGVDETSIEVTVNDTPYTTADLELIFDIDMLYFTPGVDWLEGDSVEFCVTNAEDLLGNIMLDDYCIDLIVDLTPPVIITFVDSPFATYLYEEHLPGILDSVAFLFYYYDEYGDIDEYGVYLDVYDYSTSDFLYTFNLIDHSDVFWIYYEDSVVVFWPGTSYVADSIFIQDNEYELCLYLPNYCYSGYHEMDDSCFYYYADDIEEKPNPSGLPMRSSLLPNYPDPFNATTVIPVSMGKQGYVFIDIFDVNGKQVRNMYEGFLPPGVTELRWDGTNDGGMVQTSGVYFVKLRTPDGCSVSRMCFIK